VRKSRPTTALAVLVLISSVLVSTGARAQELWATPADGSSETPAWTSYDKLATALEMIKRCTDRSYWVYGFMPNDCLAREVQPLLRYRWELPLGTVVTVVESQPLAKKVKIVRIENDTRTTIVGASGSHTGTISEGYSSYVGMEFWVRHQHLVPK
jgi:hypothetical protein